MSKGKDRGSTQQKKQPQKTIKEKRREKREKSSNANKP